MNIMSEQEQNAAITKAFNKYLSCDASDDVKLPALFSDMRTLIDDSVSKQLIHERITFLQAAITASEKRGIETEGRDVD